MSTFQIRKADKLRTFDKDVPGYEGLYKINKLGDIYSIRKRQIINIRTKPNGYNYVPLYKSAGYKNRYIHRLVAETYLQNTESKRCVNHKNGVKTNNYVANLEWNTHKENNHHANKLGLNDNRGENNGGAKLTSANILHMRRLASLGYNSNTLANMFGITQSAAYNIINFKSWKHLN